MLSADLFQPIRAPAACSHHHPLGKNSLLRPAVIYVDATAYVTLQNEVGAFAAEEHLHPSLLQILLDGQINILCLFRTHMPNGTIHQLKAGANRPLADILYFLGIRNAFHLVGRAKVQIDFIRIFNGFLGNPFPN
ncbi:hypothetical protein SDC9_128666 [bioreactor metagenome]|uniref:Uncharacterized protein n=1 Tax=bioreactor metagenome TaxID=1076179 RepID=A0A645CWR5_9ZZZZ